MSDLVNALQTSGRSSSVLGAIANPATVNPLAAYGAAAKTAGEIYNVQDLQAQKAWGEALQQATGPDGITDFDKAKAIAAGNPLAAMGMMKGLRGATELTGATQDQGVIRNKALTDAMTSALNAPDDQLHDAVVAGTQKLVASGAMTQEQAHRALLAMPNDPTQLRTQMERNRVALLPPGQQEGNLYGTTYQQNVGGAIQSGTQAPASRGGGQQPTTAIPTGPSPEQLTAPFKYTDPKTGQEVTTTLGDFLRQSGLTIPGGGGPQPATGGKGATPPVPSTIPGGGVYRPPGGTPAPTPPGGAPAPVTPPPAATPTPTVATPPTPAPAPTAQPSGPQPVPTGPMPGKVAQLETDQKQFAADQTAMPQRQTQNQNLQHAYDALKLITTGKSSETISDIRSRLAGLGLLPAGQVSDQAAFELFRKYTERTIADAGNAGGTDLSRKVAEASNAGTSLTNPANLAVIRNDIGKVRQQMAANMTAPNKETGAGYGEHAANTASNTDYRGFNWDQYSASEQADIKREVTKGGQKAQDALARAIGMGRTFWPVQGGGPVVPRG